MTAIQALILGIVEGVTEFLPISSTGHLILTSKLLGIADSDFLKSFEIAIQFGAILAVVVLYWSRLFGNRGSSMVPIFSRIHDFIGTSPSGKKIPSSVDVWKKISVAFLPTAIIGFLFYKILKQYLLSNDTLVLWSLFLGGIILIVFELWYRKVQASSFRLQEITYKKSFLIGVWQALAIIPGVSRSGATIVGGLAMGISREAIVEFSFLLAVPTMAAATGYDLLKNGASFSGNQIYVLILGFVVSFVVAMAAVTWFIGYIKNHSFIWFGVYRILAAIVFYILIFQFKI